MDQEIFGALIGAIATVAAALIGLVTGRRQQKKERVKDQDAFASVPKLSTSTHSVEIVESRTEFDENGSGKHSRRWLGLRTVQSLQNLRVPYRMSASGPNGSIGRPQVKEADGSVLTATWHGNVESAIIVEGSIVLNGVFGPTTGFVGYELEQVFESGLFVSRKEVEAAYRDDDWHTEYVGISVRDPIGRLKMAVVFPPSYEGLKPPPTAVVFIGESERVHRMETERVGRLLTITANVAAIAVENPLEGMQYAITWMPPDRPAAADAP